MTDERVTTPDTALPAHVAAVFGVFSTDGPLAQHVPGYERREGQVKLSTRIPVAWAEDRHLVSEAPTGVGKSFAYLVPVAESEKRIIVSTATRALQDQLDKKDVPLLQKIFPNFTAVRVKGRAAYICLAEYERSIQRLQESLDGLETPSEVKAWGEVSVWIEAERTAKGSGDIDEAPIALSDDIRHKITTDADSCLGNNCRLSAECFSQRVRAAAMTANVVIVNHAIFLMDLAVRAKTAGEAALLPSTDFVIIDEAHRLQDSATSAFGVELTLGRWLRVERRLSTLYGDLPPDMQAEVNQPYRTAKARTEETNQVILSWFDSLLDLLKQPKAPAMMPLETVPETVELAMKMLVADIGSVVRAVEKVTIVEGQEERARWQKFRAQVGQLWHDLRRAISRDPGDVVYFERMEGRFPRARVKVLPIHVAPILREALWQKRRVVAVSATLATGGGFDYWRDAVGCGSQVEMYDIFETEAERPPDGEPLPMCPPMTMIAPSPFDFARQACLYLPKDGSAFTPPRPGSKEAKAYEDRLVCEIQALLQASNGRAFVLFASGRMMRMVAEALRAWMPWPMFVQGDGPTGMLLEQFKAKTPSVLLGMKTFWEGVDVQGPALSCVIIDKLPFPSPDDLLWSARCQAMGERWFSEMALPEVALSLKQGAGRLIRTTMDTGCIALLDGRLSTKSYGQYILRSLPPAKRVSRIEDVAAFFAKGV